MQYITFDENSMEIIGSGVCSDDAFLYQLGNNLAVNSLQNITSANHYVLNGAVVAYTQSQVDTKANRPDRARWSNQTMQWEDQRSLQVVKLMQWQKIKDARAAELESPFSTPYGMVDAKGTSKTDITDAVLMLQTLAAMGTPTTIDFTMADNTTATLTTAQMVTVGLLLGQKVQAAHATARARRAVIEAATTTAEVEAITWV